MKSLNKIEIKRNPSKIQDARERWFKNVSKVKVLLTLNEQLSRA